MQYGEMTMKVMSTFYFLNPKIAPNHHGTRTIFILLLTSCLPGLTVKLLLCQLNFHVEIPFFSKLFILYIKSMLAWLTLIVLKTKKILFFLTSIVNSSVNLSNTQLNQFSLNDKNKTIALKKCLIHPMEFFNY